MGRRGPVPGEDPTVRPRVVLTLRDTEGEPKVSAAPAGLLSSTRKEWEEYWADPVSRILTQVDWPAICRLFRYRDEHRRAWEVFCVVLICPACRTTPPSQIATGRTRGGRRARCIFAWLLTSPFAPTVWERRWANDTHGFALAAHPGQSQGRPSTNAGSRPKVRQRPAHPAFAP